MYFSDKTKIEGIAKEVILKLHTFTQPSFREKVEDVDDWIIPVNTMLQLMPRLLELSNMVFNETVLEEMVKEENQELTHDYDAIISQHPFLFTQMISKFTTEGNIKLLEQTTSTILSETRNHLYLVYSILQSLDKLVHSSTRPVEKNEEKIISLRNTQENITKTQKSFKPVLKHLKKALKHLKKSRNNPNNTDH